MIAPMRILELSIRHSSSEGTFQSAMNLPDRIAKDGFDIVYVLPWMKLNRSLSASPYSVVDYLSIDDALGSLRDAHQWIQRCHDVGLDVVLDMPLNHTSPAHHWRANEDWYSRNEEGNAHSPEGTNWSDVLQLNHLNSHVAAACNDVLKFWMDAGIDGFRLDAVSFIPDEILQLWSGDLARAKHVWCDSQSFTKRHPFFTSYLNHEAFELAQVNLNAWVEIVKSPSNGGILYLSNHDTLHRGLSPQDQWKSQYGWMRKVLEDSSKDFMLSWCDWIDSNTRYSFLE